MFTKGELISAWRDLNFLHLLNHWFIEVGELKVGFEIHEMGCRTEPEWCMATAHIAATCGYAKHAKWAMGQTCAGENIKHKKCIQLNEFVNARLKKNGDRSWLLDLQRKYGKGSCPGPK